MAGGVGSMVITSGTSFRALGDAQTVSARVIFKFPYHRTVSQGGRDSGNKGLRAN